MSWWNLSLFSSGSTEDLVKPFKEVMKALEGDNVTLPATILALYKTSTGINTSPVHLHSFSSQSIQRQQQGCLLHMTKSTKEFHLNISLLQCQTLLCTTVLWSPQWQETPKLCTKTFGAKTTQYSTTSTRGPHYPVGGALLVHCVQPFSQSEVLLWREQLSDWMLNIS